MIKSMTGYGRGEYAGEHRNVTTEIKSVNHRHCDVTVRIDRTYSFMEDNIRKTVKNFIKRGKVEVYVTVECISGVDVTIELNRPVTEQYIEVLTQLQNDYDLDGEVDLALIAGYPDVLKKTAVAEDRDEVSRSISSSLMEALENLDRMRRIEGEKLAEELLEQGESILEFTQKIEAKAQTVPKDYAQRLKKRIREMIGDSATVSEERILAETALFADKCSIDEEIVRLRSHVHQLKRIIFSGGEADGKKLDFLLQEMNREANTMGAKANDIEITENVLLIKSEIEKIREQAQNIQ